MSKFTKAVRFTTEFDGDTVSMSLARLKRADMMKLSSYISIGPDGEALGELDQTAIMEVAVDFLPRYVTNFAGLMTEDGETVSLEEMIEEAYFFALASNIIAEIFNISNMGKGDEKNSDKQPNTSTAELETLEANPSPDLLASNG